MLVSSAPELRIHYLGHAAFLLFFDNGVSLLMDYGQSYAYGLDSPIYDVPSFQPTIVTYSHHHVDHDRGQIFATARLVYGEDLAMNDILVKSIPVSENGPADNYGYLITYKGLTVFHAGDAQGDIVQIGDKEIRRRFTNALPTRLDMLLVPIGWVRTIVEQVATYVDFLRPKRVIPMHYWSEGEKRVFLAYLQSTSKVSRIHETGEASYKLFATEAAEPIVIISLTAAPCNA